MSRGKCNPDANSLVAACPDSAINGFYTRNAAPISYAPPETVLSSLCEPASIPAFTAVVSGSSCSSDTCAPPSCPAPYRPESTGAISEASAAVSTGSSNILSSDHSRKGGYIQNNSDTDIYISYGHTATVGVPSTKVAGFGGTLPLMIGEYIYRGAINAISAGEAVNVTIVTF